MHLIDLFETTIANRLRDLIVSLDGLLTQKPEEAKRNAEQRHKIFSDPITFLEYVSRDAYYLADGGYSRLMINDDEGVRGLSGVSLPGVKARWNEPEVQRIVQELNELFKNALNQPLTESHSAPLYHSTGFYNADQIIKTNRMNANTLLRYKNIRGVSFTRNLEFARHWSDIILVFDQEKLRHNYKIIPYNFYGSNYTLDRTTRKEAEEFIIGPVENANRYITDIYMCRTTSLRIASTRARQDVQDLMNDPRYRGAFDPVKIESHGELMKTNMFSGILP